MDVKCFNMVNTIYIKSLMNRNVVRILELF